MPTPTLCALQAAVRERVVNVHLYLGRCRDQRSMYTTNLCKVYAVLFSHIPGTWYSSIVRLVPVCTKDDRAHRALVVFCVLSGRAFRVTPDVATPHSLDSSHFGNIGLSFSSTVPRCCRHLSASTSTAFIQVVHHSEGVIYAVLIPWACCRSHSYCGHFAGSFRAIAEALIPPNVHRCKKMPRLASPHSVFRRLSPAAVLIESS